MILRCNGLTKRYGDQVVLDSATFEVEKGTVFTLCGPSGAGKTTLVRIVCGLLGFDAGELVLGDETVRAGVAYPRHLFGRIGVVFQEFNLFPHMTALENVTLALKKVKGISKTESDERGMVELQRVGLVNKDGEYPSSLSGGERQRVAIARALAMDPLLLLLDEPTSSLDPAVIGEVTDIIGQLSDGGSTLLVVSHNIDFAEKIASRYAVLDNGLLEVSDDAEILCRMKGKQEQ